MARNAVILSVIFTLTLLSNSHARLHPSIAVDEVITTIDPRQSEESLADFEVEHSNPVFPDTITVDLLPIRESSSINGEDLSRLIVHSLRLPDLTRRPLRLRCGGGHVSKRSIVLSYGDDMLLSMKEENAKMDSVLDSISDEKEIEKVEEVEVEDTKKRITN